MIEISLIISIIAIIISATTFWLTRIRKGIVKMTRPTVIFLGPDGSGQEHKKVFIRTLMYSTSEKGQYIQNMYVRLQRGESVQNFNVWVYDNNGLVRGSGLFISKQGIACNHHFLLPRDGTIYDYLNGDYLLQVFVEHINNKPKKIFEQKLILSKTQEDEMKSKKVGTYFDWAPNTKNYHSHLDSAPKKDKEFTDLINKIMSYDK